MGHKLIKDWNTDAGLRAVVIQVEGRHFCGYVAVGSKHPLYDVDYSGNHPCTEKLNETAREGVGAKGSIPMLLAMMGSERSLETVFDVHGSLTFSGPGSDDYPALSDEDVWWFGFDTAHAGDDPNTHHEGYVAQECERLATQLMEVAQ